MLTQHSQTGNTADDTKTNKAIAPKEREYKAIARSQTNLGV
jgi:hypothetical protein